MRIPDMIKIESDNGKRMFVKSEYTYSIYQFLTDPFGFEFEQNNTNAVKATFQAIRDFLTSVGPNILSWFYFCYDDGRKCERNVLATLDYIERILNLVERND